MRSLTTGTSSEICVVKRFRPWVSITHKPRWQSLRHTQAVWCSSRGTIAVGAARRRPKHRDVSHSCVSFQGSLREGVLWLNLHFTRLPRVIPHPCPVKRKVMFRISTKFAHSTGKCKAKILAHVSDAKARSLTTRLSQLCSREMEAPGQPTCWTEGDSRPGAGAHGEFCLLSRHLRARAGVLGTTEREMEVPSTGPAAGRRVLHGLSLEECLPLCSVCTPPVPHVSPVCPPCVPCVYPT